MDEAGTVDGTARSGGLRWNRRRRPVGGGARQHVQHVCKGPVPPTRERLYEWGDEQTQCAASAACRGGCY